MENIECIRHAEWNQQKKTEFAWMCDLCRSLFSIFHTMKIKIEKLKRTERTYKPI